MSRTASPSVAASRQTLSRNVKLLGAASLLNDVHDAVALNDRAMDRVKLMGEDHQRC